MPLTDINGRQFGWLKQTSTRPIYRQARRATSFILAACLILGLTLSVLMIGLINHLFIKRIKQLAQWINQISHSGDISLRKKYITPDELGELTCCINHMLEVLEESELNRRVSESLRRESQRALSTLMSNLPGMAYRRQHDTQWSMLFASKGALELTGHMPEILTRDQAKFGTLIHEEDRQRAFNEADEKIKQGKPFRLAYRLRTQGEGEKWVWEQGSAIIDDLGQVVAIEGFIADVTDSHTAQNELLQLANHDQLTGLPNRTRMIDRITKSLERIKTDFNHQFALIYIDFDRFKVINDSMGHGDGDKLLQQIAERIVKELPNCTDNTEQSPQDSVFRLGGDEFAIMLEPMRLVSDAVKIAEHLRQHITMPFTLNQRNIHITASMGIVTSDIGHETAEDMIRDADTAMYHAKGNGRDRHAVFNKTMYFQALERMEIEHEMRNGIDNDEFFVTYQPVISLVDGQLTGFEALVRWNHPDRGIVPPIQFIPLAEETGLIVQLGEIVLQKACHQLVRWQEIYQADPPLKMAINLSRRQLIEPGIVETINNIIEKTNVDPTWLDLEITENSIMEDVKAVLPVLNDLHDLGIKLSMDDFGTGHSSMSHLHQFPLDILKIDRAFVANMGFNSQYASITQAIIDLAHNLGMRVIAEGIEEPGQLAQLQALDCDMAQGYFFSRPLPAEEIEQWIENRELKAAG